MTMVWLDHVNIRTSDVAALSEFYENILGLPAGDRPPFGFGGAWHYCGDRAAVHLVEVPSTPAGEDPKLEHFAFRAQGLGDFVAHLKTHDIDYTLVKVPLTGNIQVNVVDPDGNHIEVQFSGAEADQVTGAEDRSRAATTNAPERRPTMRQKQTA